MTQQATRTVLLRDLIDLKALEAAIEAGHVKCQTHPSLPLFIYNYTERCQYERGWSLVTRQCRGLIVHVVTGEVLARPWPKFFNYGDPEAGFLEFEADAEVTDKADGSLGIMFPTGDPVHPWHIATRGSFVSDQARHGTSVLVTRYGDFEPPPGMTALFEVVYPANRIVLDYGKTDDLILLGAVDIATGEAVGPDWVSGWGGPVAEVFPARSLAEALAIEPRPNAEGVVVRLVESGWMVKIKQADYLSLHKLITGLNARAVWERIGAGETVEGICEALPDEFHAWVREVGAELISERDRLTAEATAEHQRIIASLPEGWTRKDFALVAAKHPMSAWLFLLLDDRDPADKIWRTLRPSAERSLVSHGEDVA